ncbi:MAG TPA: sigma-70 family RNA polymerase sigma factor [Pirellulales bacterium]|nr:sigma-70 family RNA polymerase sigma factor [Pirellulales bacterium]
MSENQGIAQREWVLTALDEFEGRLLRYSQRLTNGDSDLARDVVQHAFLRLCDQRPEELNGRLAAWLFAVCRNRAIDMKRKDSRIEPLSSACGSETHGRESDPAESAENRDAGQQIRKAIDSLPEKQRDVVNLWADGFTYREISQITEHTESYVRVIAHRAFQALRQHPLVTRMVRAEAGQGWQ